MNVAIVIVAVPTFLFGWYTYSFFNNDYSCSDSDTHHDCIEFADFGPTNGLHLIGAQSVRVRGERTVTFAMRGSNADVDRALRRAHAPKPARCGWMDAPPLGEGTRWAEIRIEQCLHSGGLRPVDGADWLRLTNIRTAWDTLDDRVVREILIGTVPGSGGEEIMCVWAYDPF